MAFLSGSAKRIIFTSTLSFSSSENETLTDETERSPNTSRTAALIVFSMFFSDMSISVRPSRNPK